MGRPVLRARQKPSLALVTYPDGLAPASNSLGPPKPGRDCSLNADVEAVNSDRVDRLPLHSHIHMVFAHRPNSTVFGVSSAVVIPR